MDVIITTNKGTSILDIELELRNGKLLGRSVVILDEMPLSDRNLTARLNNVDEMWTLRKEPRILQVERLEEMSIRTIAKPDITQTINPAFNQFASNAYHNWALDFCTEQTGSTYTYSHTGKGVDVIISDSGIRPTHNEFKDSLGVSRVQQIVWKSGQSADFYTDSDGHGSHVAGIAAGKTQGWARDANIYSMKIFDSGAYPVIESLQLIRAWHNSKGTGRPTVVNMSWGYSTSYPDNYPDSSKAGTDHPVRVASVDAEIEDMVADGIFVISSAGNADSYVAKSSDAAYNDLYYTDANFNYLPTAEGAQYVYYYKRKTPAGANGVLCVGACGNQNFVKTDRSWFSNYGTRVNIFAPGMYIQSASNTSDTGFVKMSGTSQASPQICGIVCNYLSMIPSMSSADLGSMLLHYGIVDALPVIDIGGATNLIARSIFNGLRIKNNGQWFTSLPRVKSYGDFQFLTAFAKSNSQVKKILG